VLTSPNNLAYAGVVKIVVVVEVEVVSVLEVEVVIEVEVVDELVEFFHPPKFDK
jgi:hypothetical protein